MISKSLIRNTHNLFLLFLLRPLLALLLAAAPCCVTLAEVRTDSGLDTVVLLVVVGAVAGGQVRDSRVAPVNAFLEQLIAALSVHILCFIIRFTQSFVRYFALEWNRLQEHYINNQSDLEGEHLP